MERRRYKFDVQLNSISETNNPTKVECSFIIHDFEISRNYTFISKETALKTLHTLENMPIVAKYHPVSEAGANDDALGSHEMYIGKDRETGEHIVQMDTVPIGVFTQPAYITTIVDEQGNEKEVVAGKGILWASRFPNVVGLLKEWVNEGITVVSSMEILYDSYKVEDGVTEILNYVYEGHCVLNSETRGEYKKIYPAYDVSKLTKLVAEAVNQDKSISNKEVDKMKFKKVFELSHDDIRTLLYKKLDVTLEKNTYSFIVDVYDNYFVVNIYSCDEENKYDKFFKYNYTKSEYDVEIDFDSKKEVFLKRNWEEIVPEEIQTQLNEKENKIKELKTQLNTVQTELKTIKGYTEKIETQFNEASEKITQLNSLVKELKPYKEQVEREKFEKTLNEKQELYREKFKVVGALDKFESEEVQELIKKSVCEDEEGKKAIYQLNTMIVEMIDLDKLNVNNSTVIKEVSSKRKDLIHVEDDFESRYSL